MKASTKRRQPKWHRKRCAAFFTNLLMPEENLLPDHVPRHHGNQKWELQWTVKLNIKTGKSQISSGFPLNRREIRTQKYDQDTIKCSTGVHGDYSISRVLTSFSCGSFAVISSAAWNSLSQKHRRVRTVSTFKQLLKTEQFCQPHLDKVVLVFVVLNGLLFYSVYFLSSIVLIH